MASIKDTVTTTLRNLGAYNKALVSLLGGVLLVANQATGLVHGAWATTVVAAVTAVSVFLVKNQDNIDRLGDDAADVLGK